MLILTSSQLKSPTVEVCPRTKLLPGATLLPTSYLIFYNPVLDYNIF